MDTDTVGLYVKSMVTGSNFTVEKDVRSCTENKYDGRSGEIKLIEEKLSEYI